MPTIRLPNGQTEQIKSQSPRDMIQDLYKPGLGEQAVNFAGGLGSKIVEAGLGLPGNIAEGLGRVATGVGSLAGGKNYDQLLQESGNYRIPTSEDVKNWVTDPVRKKIGLQTEPQGPISNFLEGATETATSLALPFLGPGTKIATAIGSGLVGETSKEIIKGLGGGPIAQELGKFLTMVGYGTAGTRKNLEKQANADFKKVDSIAQTLPAGNAIKLEQDLDKGLSRINKRDIPAETKAFLSDRYNHVKNLAKDNQIPMTDAVNSLRDVNGWWGKIPDKGEPYMKQLNGIISDFIETNGASNPEFVNAFNNSNEIYKGIQAAGSVSDFIKKYIPTHTIKNDTAKSIINGLLYPAATAVGGTALALGGGLPGLATGAAAGIAGRQGYKAWKLFQESPIAANAYKELIKAGVQQNAKALTNATVKFNNAVNRFEKENPKWEETPYKGIKGVSIKVPSQSTAAKG